VSETYDREACIRTAIVDLTLLGTKLPAEPWYLGLADQVMNPIAKNDRGDRVIKQRLQKFL
jgi:hypothetical protein